MRWIAAACVICPFLFSGCNLAYYTGLNAINEPAALATELQTNHRLRAEAREVLRQQTGKHSGEKSSPAFTDGFVDGYADQLNNGGPPVAPPVAPPRYRRHADDYTPEGLARAHDYLQGFKSGAESAAASGRRHVLTGAVEVPPPQVDQPVTIVRSPDPGPAADDRPHPAPGPGGSGDRLPPPRPVPTAPEGVSRVMMPLASSPVRHEERAAVAEPPPPILNLKLFPDSPQPSPASPAAPPPAGADRPAVIIPRGAVVPAALVVSPPRPPAAARAGGEPVWVQSADVTWRPSSGPLRPRDDGPTLPPPSGFGPARSPDAP